MRYLVALLRRCKTRPVMAVPRRCKKRPVMVVPRSCTLYFHGVKYDL